MAGLYIHIPFCKQACRYCDFHFSVNADRVGDMVDAINLEMALQKDYLGTRCLDTVYFGGGTPSLLKAPDLYKIVNSLSTHFSLNAACEITLEANPDDLSIQKLNLYKQMGINRLSIGIQSFSNPVLRLLNRSHDAKTALLSIERARKAGFDNLSLDLMYSIPSQDHALWINNIETALQLYPEHLSAYALTIEKKTVFDRWLSQDKIVPFSEADSAWQFEYLVTALERKGYAHYEISNFCRPDFHAKHNSNYWKQTHYLGIGPAAHSFNGVSRQSNVSNNALYIQAIRNHKIPCKREVLSRENKINEYIFTSLRTMWGCSFKKLKTDYDIDMQRVHKTYLHKLEAAQLAFMKEDHLLLTLHGKLVADKIIADLFVDTVA